MRFVVHMLLHFLVPALVALGVCWWRHRQSRRSSLDATASDATASDATWRTTLFAIGRPAFRLWCVMIVTMLVDLDHLVADPILDPQRCSLGFHPLHRVPAILLYGLMTAIPRWRWWGVGLLIHMLLDGLDCWMM